jgi:hypothetical protein
MKIVEDVLDKVFNSRKYEMFERVYNVEKDELQTVISEIPCDKRKECRIPITKRGYICTKVGTNIWSIELGTNLRPATVFEKNQY